MKIFAISDIHSAYTPMKKALDEAGFESGNPNHLLISCGDNWDRMNESQKVLDYLMSVPNKVLVKGNHESLFVDCCLREFAYGYDFSNGTHRTICDLDLEAMNFPDACTTAYHKVKPLLNQMVDYFETEHYIFVHSWIPVGNDWREEYKDWENARWGNPFDIVASEGNPTGKIIVHGHFHNSYWWSHHGVGSEWGEDACFDICEHDGCIGLDACTAYSKKVNVLVIEDNLLEEIE